MRKNISALLIAISLMAGIANGQSGHGTHTPGTVAAVGNNGVSIGGSGRDVLVGGTGAERTSAVPTGSVVFFTGLEMAISGIQLLVKFR